MRILIRVKIVHLGARKLSARKIVPREIYCGRILIPLRYMISIPHFLMSVHCREIDADHYYYLIMSLQNTLVSTYAVE